MKTDSSILGLRALQATRRLHLPTYVATRFLLQSAAGHPESTWAESVLPRKYPARMAGRFIHVKKFKKLLNDGTPEYREFYVPSPTTAITEALVLANLASSPRFSKSANVYSYLWPKRPNSPFNFEHYVSGYRARNHAIAQYVERNRDVVLIVSDIEKFYPSVLRSRATVLFQTALRESNMSKDLRSTASTLLEHLFAGVPGDRGIATGPELSHVIGDIALSNVDKELSQRYGDAYFRYVDDIVIAVPASDKGKTIALLTKLISNEELTVHAEKTDVVAGEAWLKHGPHHAHRIEADSFEALVFMLKVYLLRNKDAENGLAERLKSNGFAIPLERISRAGRSGSFIRRFNTLRKRGWWVAFLALVSDESDVLEKAVAVRRKVRESLDRILSDNVPVGATRRRWFVQRIRYLTNRAFYLMPVSDLKFLIQPLSRWPEFVETVALLKMLIEEEVNELLTMPGPALLAGAGLLRETGRRLPDIKQIQNNNPNVVDALSTLLLFDVVGVDESLFKAFDGDNNELLRFCAGQIPSARVREDFSYIDELRCLQLTRTAQDNLSMIESRFSDQEGVVFDALDIGGEYSY